MKLEIALIRHGQLYGGEETRLTGKNGDLLCEEGKARLLDKKEAGVYPEAALVFSGGTPYCLETARIIYTGLPIVVVNGLDAPDYGLFEGKLYAELAKDETFMWWISKTNAGPCPQGGDPYAHIMQSAASFRKICDEMAVKGLERAAVVSHKTIIKAILQRYVVPRSNYVDWRIPSGGGYIMMYDTVNAYSKIIGFLGN